MLQGRRVLAVTTVLAFVGVALQASAQNDGFPKSPTGKPSPAMATRTMALGTLESCWVAMDAHKNNPALATDDEYNEYINGRDTVVARDPNILVFDASLAISRVRTPSKMFPACTKFFTDYANGVNAADAPLSANCEPRVKPFLKWAGERLADYQKAGPKYGHVSSARQMLENARFAMYKTGGGVMGHCSMNDKFKKALAPLKAQLDAVEAQIVAAETAKGVKFAPVDNKDLGVGVSYVDLKTNQKVVGDQ